MADSGYISNLTPLQETNSLQYPAIKKCSVTGSVKDSFSSINQQSNLLQKDLQTEKISSMPVLLNEDDIKSLEEPHEIATVASEKKAATSEQQEITELVDKLKSPKPNLTLTEFSKLLSYPANKNKEDPDVKKIINFVNQHINDFQKTMSELLTAAIKTETDPKKKAELEKVQKTIVEIESFKDKPEEILKQIESNPVLKEALGFFLQNATREVENQELTLEQPKQQELNQKLLNTVIQDETTLSIVAEGIFRANPILANNTFGAENARSLLHLLFEQRKQQKSQEAEKSKKQEEEKRAEETKIQAEKEREIKITEKKSRELRQQEELKASLAPGSKHYAKLAQILGRKGFLDLADYLSVGGRDLIQTLVNNGTLKDPRALEYLQQSSDNIFSQPTKRPQLLV